MSPKEVESDVDEFLSDPEEESSTDDEVEETKETIQKNEEKNLQFEEDDDDFQVSSDIIFDIELPWLDFINQVIFPNINATRKLRTSCLKGVIAKLNKEEIPDNVLVIILQILIKTVFIFTDSKSVNLVFSIFEKLFEIKAAVANCDTFENPFTKVISKLLDREFKSSLLRLEPGLLFRIIAWTTKILNLMLNKQLSLNKFEKLDELVHKLENSQSLRITLELHFQCLDAIAISSNFSTSHFKKAQKVFLKCLKLTYTIYKNFDAESFNKFFQYFFNKYVTQHTSSNTAILGSLVNFKILNFGEGLNELEQSHLFKFFSEALLSSKNIIPHPYLDLFNLFLDNYMNEHVFYSIASNAERLMLRSPEVSLKVTTHLIKHGHFEVSVYFKKNAEHVINLLKFANVTVKNEALLLFKALCENSQDEIVLKYVTELMLKAITAQSSNVDQKLIYYNAFSFLPPSSEVSKTVIEILTVIATKEKDMQSLQISFSHLSRHIKYYSDLATVDSKFISSTLTPLLIKGVSESKHSVRKGFVSCLYGLSSKNAFETLTVSNVLQLAELATKIIDKVQAAGISLVDPKKDTPYLAEAYYCLSWLLRAADWETKFLKKDQIGELLNLKKTLSVLSASHKFLFNEKFFSKLLITEEEHYAFIDVIFLILNDNELFSPFSSDSANFSALSCALCYLAVLSPHKDVREKVHQELQQIVIDKKNSEFLIERVVEVVKVALTPLLQQKSTAEIRIWDDKIIRSSKDLGYRIFRTIQSVVPNFSANNMKKHLPKPVHQKSLLNLIIITCSSVVTESMGNDAWVSLCFRSGYNPKVLIEENASFLFGTWLKSNSASEVGKISSGILAATSLFTSVAPHVVLQSLVTWIAEGLSDNLVSGISASDLQIWKTKEGELCFDPTKKKVGQIEERPKNAEEKWEQDLRKELKLKGQASNKPMVKQSGKSGNGKSDTKQAKIERELIAAQLDKEVKIRKSVQSTFEKITAALDIFDSILSGFKLSFAEDLSEVVDNFMSILTETILKVITREMSLISKNRHLIEDSHLVIFLGRRAIQTYINLGSIADYKLEDLVQKAKPSLPMCILSCLAIREHETDGIPILYARADLQEFAKKIFGSLKSMYSLSSPLRPSSFSYVFPLCRAIILVERKVSTLKNKQVAELTMLASEILLEHCSLGSCIEIPRSEIVKCLVFLLEHYPRLHKTAKEGLLTFCSAVGSSQGEINSITGNPDFASDVILQLLESLLNFEEIVRDSCLQSLQYLQIPEHLSEVFAVKIFVAKHDNFESIKQHAETLWDTWDQNYVIEKRAINDIVDVVVHELTVIRESAGKALCSILKLYPNEISPTLEKLYGLYKTKAAPIVPEYDEYGMLIATSIDKKDEWPARAGIASALNFCSELIQDPVNLFSFFVDSEALGDANEHVRNLMLEAALSSIRQHGKGCVKELLAIFDAYLQKPAQPSETHDRIRENVVILLGTLAQHLDPSDTLIPQVVSKLMETLKTPSEAVQMAVAECLPSLVKLIPKAVVNLIYELLDQLVNAKRYAERRGAAYGLAGVVKGSGVSSLKEFNIMSDLKEYIEDKKNLQKREGALFAYETLSRALGRLFEPYVMQILPVLLNCYGDSSKEVREATHDACKVIMSKLSGHCVKLVLPSLLNGLAVDNWRTKLGSVEVLGSMAFLAPKQLSLSLPQVVPKLTDALADSHSRVQAAAQTALTNFGQVIKNPEIQALVPVMIQALVDPNKKTNSALVALLETAFVHYIDAPSLALIVPILQRGLRERSTEVKKKAAQIMGNMAWLTDQKDLIPYLKSLLPGLKDVLVDPVPEARATAAKALGSMVERMGEDSFPGLVAELLATLKSDTSGVDRSGASQGLSEILSGLGKDRLEGLLPEIILNAGSQKTYVREGFMTLLIYLPATHGASFQPYLVQIIPPILRGLADEYETVRDSALKAAQMVVKNYSTSSIDLLLPELENGLNNENWRIRASSLQLMGDLLYRISGISAVHDEDEEADTTSAEAAKKALVAALGMDRYQSILASIYIIRCDSHGVVRQSSLHVWKSLVNNTPRTLKDILPVLMEELILSLASSSADKRSVAARTLGELVRKMGENILLQIVPLLENGLLSENEDSRQGVCVGMSEIMAAAGKQSVQDFALNCIPGVRKALIDEEPVVREAAAVTFDTLHQHIGSKAIDEILPSLLNELKSGTGSGRQNYALEALKEIMAVRSNVVFPVLIPTLIAKPITVFNARALGSLISVAGHSLNKRLNIILLALVGALEQKDAAVIDVRESLKTLMTSISDDGVDSLMTILNEFISEGTHNQRKAACELASIFFSQNPADHSNYTADWISKLVGLLKIDEANEVDLETVKAAWNALEALTKSISNSELEKFVVPCRRAISLVSEDMEVGETLAGFNLPKGISPIIPIFLQGLMFGSSDIRAQGALGLGDLVKVTSPDSLRSFVTQITGPLIRVIGDRFPATVKGAILQTIGEILNKVPALLKPFLPQLQRTFIKCLFETATSVRDKAARCLSILITMQTRLDPLVIELTQGIRNSEDNGIKEAMLKALFGLMKVLNSSEDRDINSTSKTSIQDLILHILLKSSENDDGLRVWGAKCFGSLCCYLEVAEAETIIKSKILKFDDETSWTYMSGSLLAITEICKQAPDLIKNLKLLDSIVSCVTTTCTKDKLQIVEPSITVMGLLLSHKAYKHEVEKALIPLLISNLTTGSPSEIRRESLVILKEVSKKDFELIEKYLPTLIPATMNCVRDRVIPVKLAAEKALYHALQIGKNDEILQNVIKTCDAVTARSVGDYAKRVLSKFNDTDSDEGSEMVVF
ncbi:translational activator of GCN4 [Clydaea vesicula]|uniref:Translational activator of GCN4 n=1 Tax=Clydaea vesicula TaxID=447962 RepID=A0AAD5U8I4_9FUNG|nr:translational activator of GCN4 [Clydaea vesicula]